MVKDGFVPCLSALAWTEVAAEAGLDKVPHAVGVRQPLKEHKQTETLLVLLVGDLAVVAQQLLVNPATPKRTKQGQMAPAALHAHAHAHAPCTCTCTMHMQAHAHAHATCTTCTCTICTCTCIY